MSSRADLVVDAYATGRSIPPFSESDQSFDEDTAYAIALEVHERRIARGERPVGRKIGFTNRTLWELYGVDTPIWAYMYDTTVFRTPTLDISRFLEPRIEPEIQLHFGSAPPVTDDEEAILASVDRISHGFEIVQSPFPGWRFAREDTIAACSLHGALVMGQAVPVSGIDDLVTKLRAFTVVLYRDGVEVAQGAGANVLDSPLLAFAHLAAVLEGTTHTVGAGEIVTTGTLTDAFPVAAGETWTTTLDGLDLSGASLTLA